MANLHIKTTKHGDQSFSADMVEPVRCGACYIGWGRTEVMAVVCLFARVAMYEPEVLKKIRKSADDDEPFYIYVNGERWQDALGASQR